MVRWVVGSILHGVDPLSYFSLQPVLHDWCNKGRGMCYHVFNERIQSKLLLRTPVTGTGFSVRDRKKRGAGVRGWGGTACTGGYKGVRAVQAESVAGGGIIRIYIMAVFIALCAPGKAV